MTTRFSRRLFLGGAGVALALPTLVSLGPLSRTSRADTPTRPRRLVFLYTPNGMHMPSWTPSTTGTTWSSPILDDLGDMKAQTLVISGLRNLPGQPDGAGDHGAGTGAYLTCTKVLKTEGDDIKSGISVDQVAAPVLGRDTRYKSIELGLEGGAALGGCDSGYSCAYTRNIAWTGEKTPLPKIVNPRVVFDRLFAGYDPSVTAEVRDRRLRQRKSILDWVRTDANTLSSRASASDRQKLDEYLTGVREVESRLVDDGPTCEAPAAPPTAYDVDQHFELMADLLVIAFKCDLSRVSTFMLANAGSGRNYTWLDPSVIGGHHDISHHQDDPENFRKLEVINRWEVRKAASLARKLHAVVDDEGDSLLDQSLIYMSSEISDGNSHSHRDLPVLLLGKGGGTVTPGRHIRRNDQPMANLFLAMLGAVDVPANTFGADSTGRLDLQGG